MSTITEPTAKANAASDEQRFVFYDADWSKYEAILSAIGDGHTRVTYDRGKLELMSPSGLHERLARRTHLFIFLLAEELDYAIVCFGSTTWRRHELDRGLEADDCYYVQRAQEFAGRTEIDLAVDPPPDLAIEIEVSRSALDRMGIYAALGVPEVWRCDAEQFRSFQLQPDGVYAPQPQSLSLPQAPLGHLPDLLGIGATLEDVAWSRETRRWLRENLR